MTTIPPRKQNMQNRASYVHHGFYVRLMDSFFDFSINAFKKIDRKPELYDMSLLFSSLWTLRSAYNLFWQGYYCNATGLLRSAFESIAVLVGERNGCLNRFQLCNILEKAHKQRLAPWDLANDGREIIRKARDWMVGKTSGLTTADQKALADFLKNLHSSVHVSFFSFFALFKHGKETGGIGVIPKFDETSTGMFVCASEAVFWMHLRLQQSIFTPSDPKIMAQFSMLDKAFSFASLRWSNTGVTEAWKRLLDTKFELTWVGKDERPRLEPRVLVEYPVKSYGNPRILITIPRGGGDRYR